MYVIGLAREHPSCPLLSVCILKHVAAVETCPLALRDPARDGAGRTASRVQESWCLPTLYVPLDHIFDSLAPRNRGMVCENVRLLISIQLVPKLADASRLDSTPAPILLHLQASSFKALTFTVALRLEDE